MEAFFPHKQKDANIFQQKPSASLGSYASSQL
jgi:hypothetical protein